MKTIDRIRDDLKMISPWPWEAQSDNETTISAVTGELLTPTDAEFALKSPSRIVLLVNYYKAAEYGFKVRGEWKCKYAHPAPNKFCAICCLQQARAGL